MVGFVSGGSGRTMYPVLRRPAVTTIARPCTAGVFNGFEVAIRTSESVVLVQLMLYPDLGTLTV